MKPFLEDVSQELAFHARHDTYMGGFPFRWHYHPHLELTYIVQGEGLRYVGDSIESFRAKDLVLLGSYLPHSWYGQNEKQSEAIVIQFLPNCLGDNFFQLKEMETVRGLFEKALRGIQFPTNQWDSSLVTCLLRLVESQGALRIALLIEVLGRIAQLSSRTLCKHQRFYRSLERQQARVDRICGYIHSHYLEELKQEPLAAKVNMSTASFSRFFKSTLGVCFQDYVNRLRVAHACQLLTQTDLSILEISEASGFNNLSNFNRRFKAFQQQSPSQFRQAFTR